MKRFVKICTILTVILIIAGSGCLIAAFSMDAAIPNVVGKIRDRFYTSEAQQEYRFHKAQINRLNIDIGSGTLKIVQGTGDEFILKNENTEAGIRAVLSDDGNLEIDKRRIGFRWFGIGFDNGKEAVLTIPKDVSMESIELECGSGTIHADSLSADIISADCGSGDIRLGKVSAKETEIDCGSGEVSMTLPNQLQDYDYEVDCGSGDVVMDARHYSDMEYHDNGNAVNNGRKNIEIDCGSGKVNIGFDRGI